MLFCRIKHKKLQIPKYTPRILPRSLIRCSAAPEHDGTPADSDEGVGSTAEDDAPAAEPDALRRMIAAGAEHNWLDVILTTHSHHDHVGALAEMIAATGARTAAGAEDAKEIAEKIDLPLAHGDVIEFGEQRVEIIHLRGHTPGSVAVLWRGGEEGDHLFTGDSLFPGGVGNTDRDPQRFAQLIDDVEQRIFDRLDDATWVYPGHGDDTTLGAERAPLPAWRERGW